LALLIGSLIALAFGPLLVAGVRNVHSAAVAIDSFVVVAIGGLVLIHILPDSLVQGGWVALVALMLGMFGPLIAERSLRPPAATTAGRAVIILSLIGLAAHGVVDGLALGHNHDVEHAMESAGHHHDHDHTGDMSGLLALAVILHRLPVAIGVWWLIPRTLGRGVAILVLVILGVSTIVGFFLAGTVVDASSPGAGLAAFQALLAGSLLHVVLHSHLPPRKGHTPPWELASAAGTALALASLAAVSITHPSPVVEEAGRLFVKLAFESAPALLFAYIAVGFVRVLLPGDRLLPLLGRRPLTQALRGVAAGLPLPICSCGIVPLYRQLVTSGAPVTAAMAFLIATPELEVAAFLLTASLIDAPFAFLRLAAAAVLAIAVAWWVGRRVPALAPAPVQDGAPDPCTAPHDQPAATRSAWHTTREAFRFGFGEAVDHTGAWILFGLGIAALAGPYLEAETLGALPVGLDVLLAALLGLPLYVCASGSTPLAAVLIATGLSPGAALAFLLTGPATNLTTFGVLAKLHGGAVALRFALAVMALAVGMGLLTNQFFPTLTLPPSTLAESGPSPIQIISLTVLTLVFLSSLLRQGTRAFIEQVAITPFRHARQTPAAG
jgi:uncharacterized membrane protein YraQ (UPF0718 family)